MKKFLIIGLLALPGCSAVGTFKPMAINPAVPGVVFGMVTCAVASGLCVIP